MRLIAIIGFVLVYEVFSIHCDKSSLESRITALEKSLLETKDELETTLEEIADLKGKDGKHLEKALGVSLILNDDFNV